VNAKMIFELTNSTNSPSIKYFKDFKSFFIDKYGAESYERKQESIVARTIKEATQKNDKSLFADAINLVKANKMSRGDEVITKQSLFFYSGVKDMVNYDKVAMTYLKKTKNLAPNVFTEIMGNYISNIENPKLLTKAISICRKSVNKEDKFYNNIALASLLYKNKNQAEAFAVAQYALDLGRKEGVNYWPAQELINKIQIERGSKK
jgi:hypothetical protein